MRSMYGLRSVHFIVAFRRGFIVGLLAGLAVCCVLMQSAQAGNVVPTEKGTLEENVRWYDVRLLSVEGQGWQDVASPFDRFPARAESTLRPPVWGLSRHSAGIAVRFVTDAETLHARWTLTSDRLEMSHMPATGVSGLDLYVRVPDGHWRWLANGRPSGKTTTAQLYGGIPAGEREFLLYLPLYNGVTSVELGLPEGSHLKQSPPRLAGHAKPIVFYGTSITQGACASRPGMVHTAIIGRKLDQPVINLGFSGNGRLEAEVGALMAEIDAAVYVIDCLPNVDAATVTERTEPLVRQLKKAHPETPILLVEDRNYTDSFLVASKRQRNESNQKALRAVYDRLKSDGVEGLYYLEAEKLLGDDGEGTVDTSHPTDLGFMRQADAFLEVLRPILNRP